MPLFLIYNSDGEEIRRVSTDELGDADSVTVGRSSTCTVSLKNCPGVDRRVGSHHFSLVRRRNAWWIVDAQSSGIYKDSSQFGEAILQEGDRIQFGSCFLAVGEGAGPSGYELFYATNVGHVICKPLWFGKNWVGKSSKNTIQIIDGVGCSRRHARISVSGANVTVEDLNSSNGTRVDGKRVTEPTKVVPGSVIKAGRVRLWIDHSDRAEEYLTGNTIWKDKYFRIFLLLVVILLLVFLKNFIFKRAGEDDDLSFHGPHMRSWELGAGRTFPAESRMPRDRV